MTTTKILVVDDDPDFVELLSFNLSKEGYDILTANNGLDALFQARRFLPDLILLDVMMEGMDGYAVSEILRRQPSTKWIPIILITAATGTLARLNGMSAGADGFVQKPFSPQDLMNLVKRVLQKAEARMQFHLTMEENASWI